MHLRHLYKLISKFRFIQFKVKHGGCLFDTGNKRSKCLLQQRHNILLGSRSFQVGGGQKAHMDLHWGYKQRGTRNTRQSSADSVAYIRTRMYLSLRLTFCDPVVLYTVLTTYLTLDKIDLRNRKSLIF